NAVPTPVVTSTVTSEISPDLLFAAPVADIVQTIDGTTTTQNFATRPNGASSIEVALPRCFPVPVVLSANGRIVQVGRRNGKLVVVIVAAVASLNDSNR